MENQAAVIMGRVESGWHSITTPRIRALVSRLSRQPKPFHLAMTTIGILAVAALDALVHPHFSFLDFYLVPIVYALWFLGANYALVFSCLGLAIPGAQDWMDSANPGGNSLAPYWNLLANLGLFGLIVWLLALLKDAMEHERAMERERAERELEIARQVQLRLLPAEAPAVSDLEAGFAYQAARAVGGDYYDFIPLGEGRLGLAVGDVSGKGLAAALLMATLQGLVRTGLPLCQGNLSEFMDQLNGTLYSLTDSNRYSTLFIGLYDSHTGRLEYVNAGHNSPFLLRDRGGRVERTPFQFDSGGAPLGLLPWSHYDTGLAVLSPGDLLIAFTDGVVDALDPNDEQFGEARLEECAARACREAPTEICAHVLDEIADFVRTAPQFDDIALMVLRPTGRAESARS